MVTKSRKSLSEVKAEGKRRKTRARAAGLLGGGFIVVRRGFNNERENADEERSAKRGVRSPSFCVVEEKEKRGVAAAGQEN